MFLLVVDQVKLDLADSFDTALPHRGQAFWWLLLNCDGFKLFLLMLLLLPKAVPAPPDQVRLRVRHAAHSQDVEG